MSLSPDDIVGYRFKQALRGYAIPEVDELLDRLADQVERAEAEIASLRERVQAAEQQATSAKATEETLQRTLVVAQEAADRQIAEATAEAERVREEAGAEAQRVREEAETEAHRTLVAAQEAARREVEAARARVREAADRHAAILADVAVHRDALRADVAGLDDLVAAPPLDTPSMDLAVGELTPDTGDEELSDPEGWDTGPSPTDAPVDDDLEVEAHRGGSEPRPPFGRSSLRVRVHDDADPGSPPLGSDHRDEG